MERIRAFIAVEISADVRSRCRKLVQALAPATTEVRWVEPQALHVTLNFLGDVDMLDLPPLCAMMQAAVDALPPFDVQFVGAGAFPDAQRPRTIWLGVGQGAAELRTLQQALQRGLDTLGYRGESRQFRPHLTLGRLKGTDACHSTELTQRLLEHHAFPGGSADVNEVVLFQSTLSRSGPTYEVLGEATLGGA